MLNDRSLWLIARNLPRWSNYSALGRINRVYEQPLSAAARYLLGRGEYPCSIRLRTPAGPQALTLFNSQDAVTVHEIFCREDYGSPLPPQVVVDLGSNIGVSALYFLTRSPATYCELYEPDPRNIPKLLGNLRGFNERFTLHQAAVADRAGVLPFNREPTGRYGRLKTAAEGSADLPPALALEDPAPPAKAETISVRVEHVNAVLRRAIELHGAIDLLKVDTEGDELATVLAIDPVLRRHIRQIVIEWFDRRVQLDGFDASWSCDTITFMNKSPQQK